MARLTTISGVGGKLPAAFLLELHQYRLLFDLGEGPEAGVMPDLSNVGRVDAICLSHSHPDHTGALHLRSQIGFPPVYASELTWQQIPHSLVGEAARRILPLKGNVTIGPLTLICGRSGHAPGAVWFHLPDDGGVTYMGDWSRESLLLPFDVPPPARLLITDGSYGDRRQPLSAQMDALAAAARGGAVLPVPANGRGPEMALQMMARGLQVLLCPAIRQEVATLLSQQGLLPMRHQLQLLEVLHHQPEQPDFTQGQVIIATDAIADSGLAAQLSQRPGFRFIFSSHVAAGTRAAAMLERQQARWLPWNVHPVLDDQLWLIQQTRARQVIAAFVAEAQCQALMALAPVEFIWRELVNG